MNTLWANQCMPPVTYLGIMWHSSRAYVLSEPDGDIWAHSGAVQTDQTFDEALDSLRRQVDYMLEHNVLQRFGSFGQAQPQPAARWTRREKITLLQLKDGQGVENRELAQFLNPRSQRSLNDVYARMVKSGHVYGHDREHYWKSWPEVDDTKLFELVERLGHDWEKIAVEFPGRSWEACCSRYYQKAPKT